MNLQRTISVFIFSLLISNFVLAQNIVVDETYTAQNLVQNVLLNNSNCASSSNATATGDTFSGSLSYGYFSYSGTDFPFSSGIVLSTSRAFRTAGPNDNLISEGSPLWVGDADLEQALGISGTVNATILEFDFTPLTSNISFDYIFASEEYHGNAPCLYSDGFAFLLRPIGSSSQYENLALVPNTTTPVKVTSVHPQIGGTNGCNAINENYFAGYNGTNHPINFDGETIKMTAKANVIPGTPYHIKLVIADEKNYKYDSAIFLGGGSFNVGTDLGLDRLVATDNPICEGETYTLQTNEIGTNAYKWFKDGVEIPGEITSSYVVTEAGIYKVEVALGTTVCVASGEVKIEYSALPILVNPVTLVQCDDNTDGISNFNLTKLDTIIQQGISPLLQVDYYLNQNDATNGINKIQNPTNFSNASTNQLVAKVTNKYGCASYSVVNLTIANNALPNQNPIKICDEDGISDGKTTINLSAAVSPQVSTGLPSGLQIEYYNSATEAANQINPVANNFTNTAANSQIIYARIINGADCYGIIPVTLQIIAFNPPNFSDETIIVCENTTVVLAVPLGFSSYLWSTGIMNNSISATLAGNYSVTVSNSAGCKATKLFNLIASGPPTITSVDVNDFNGNNNSVTINYSGIGVFEFSIGGATFQDSNIFTNVNIGDYTVIVRDKNECGPEASLTIKVLDYPKYFTPNDDGFNDTWFVKNLNANATVSIFDRFGKIVYSFKGTASGWNGNYLTTQLLSDDYWFILTLETGKIIKGHFSLKR